MTFSVIMPTLQRVPATTALIDDLTASPLVGEILVINNAVAPLPYSSPKLRELRQATNIFVNPAWNLGAREATHQNLCFVNDDIRFDISLFPVVQKFLRIPVGIIAPHEHSFTGELSALDRPEARRRTRFTPVYRRTDGFGTLMFMRRKAFVPIPDPLKVWFGDDFLFHQQRHRNVVFSGVPIHTRMGATSRSAEFTSIGLEETAAYRDITPGDYEERFRRDLQVARPVRRVVRSLQSLRSRT